MNHDLDRFGPPRRRVHPQSAVHQLAVHCTIFGSRSRGTSIATVSEIVVAWGTQQDQESLVSVRMTRLDLRKLGRDNALKDILRVFELALSYRGDLHAVNCGLGAHHVE